MIIKPANVLLVLLVYTIPVFGSANEHSRLLANRTPSESCCKKIDRYCLPGMLLCILPAWVIAVSVSYSMTPEKPGYIIRGKANGEPVDLLCVKASNKSALVKEFLQRCPDSEITVKPVHGCCLNYDLLTYPGNPVPCLRAPGAEITPTQRLSKKFPQHFTKTKTKQVQKTKPQNFKKPHR